MMNCKSTLLWFLRGFALTSLLVLAAAMFIVPVMSLAEDSTQGEPDVRIKSDNSFLSSISRAYDLGGRIEIAVAEIYSLPEPYLVKDINSGGDSSTPSSPRNIQDTLFFSADDGTHGRELWKSDATEEGTVLVKDIDPGVGGSYDPWFLTEVNGIAFFRASDGSHGYELWKSDGTEEGTSLVKDINPGVGGGYGGYSVAMNGMLFFRASDGIHGSELWKSDGTEEGTSLVKDIVPGSSGSTPVWLTAVDGTLFFSAVDPALGVELWKSDGTAEGTVLVKDINPGSGSYPECLINVSSTLYFGADDGTHGRELWKSDGTVEGTVLVKDINAAGDGFPECWDPWDPTYLVGVDGTLFFNAWDGTLGWELWKSDGTTAGTVLVKDINPGVDDSWPTPMAQVEGLVFLSAWNPTTGRELWKSDGTGEGTVLIKDINPGSGSCDPHYYWTEAGGMLFFRADDGSHGEELWKSDGTPEGTVLVADINPGSGGAGIWQPTEAASSVFFTGIDGSHGAELWAVSLAQDLYVGKAVEPGTTVLPGEAITFTLTFGYAGTVTGTGAVITDVVPAEVTGISFDSSRPVTPIGTVSYTWLLGDLLPGEGGVITVTGVVSPDLSPGHAFTNTATITATLADGEPDNNRDSVRVSIQAAPVAMDDVYTTTEEIPLIVAAPGVLGNDGDQNNDPLEAVLDSPPLSGTLALNSDGAFTYTPTLDFHGVDVFTYHATDAISDSNVAAVTLTVTAVNDPPVGMDDSYTTTEDMPLIVVAPGVLANDGDVDGDPLAAVLDSPPLSGTLALNPDGAFTYTPTLDFRGIDTFTYHATDTISDSSVAAVTVTVQARYFVYLPLVVKNR
jgi:uncharacterized repeat protein (TIGR01451 family)